jgi:hypothetical protein
MQRPKVGTQRGHQTQWAAQFAVASELCKRGYEVSFTMGNVAPVADLMVAAIATPTDTIALGQFMMSNCSISGAAQSRSPRTHSFNVNLSFPRRIWPRRSGRGGRTGHRAARLGERRRSRDRRQCGAGCARNITKNPGLSVGADRTEGPDGYL